MKLLDGSVYHGSIQWRSLNEWTLGEWKDNKAHGKGKCWFKDGRIYEGLMRERSWDILLGELKGNLFDGHGVCFYQEGGKYEGDWKGGNKHGKGKFMWKFGGLLKKI